jgi:glycosyltransferase involved in cell wall biosynthesis
MVKVPGARCSRSGPERRLPGAAAEPQIGHSSAFKTVQTLRTAATAHPPRIDPVRGTSLSKQPEVAEVSSAVSPTLLTVVVPVYNGGEGIVENIGEIRRAIAERLAGELELVVVSDGSIDDTAARLLAARGDVGIRVIHYDRNLGKGYAVKAGALASHGAWVALVDADLDLDPAAIPAYLQLAREERLDFAIGSKRHPDSVVRYPVSRRIASRCYQLLNRLLFRLDVRDTQVGLKVFNRAVVEEVFPLLLVKRFAFDLELLAVAKALGRGRIRELPIRLEYRFSGSQLGSRAVVRALIDTAAIFYRLRILRTYQRKRHLLRGSPALTSESQPVVSFIGDPEAAVALDYARLDVVGRLELGDALQRARGDVVAVLAPGAGPAGNWLSAAVPFFADRDVAAVVTPALAPSSASLRERAAAAVLESRLGGGSRRSRYFPGNVRVVSDEPVDSVVIRRADLAAAIEAGIAWEQLAAWLAERGRRTVYTPDASITTPPPPLAAPHLRSTYAHARLRGAIARRTRGRSLSAATTFSLLPVACAAIGLLLLALAPAGSRPVALALVVAYLVVVAGSTALAAVRFRSARVGMLVAPALVATQGAYVAGFLRGLFTSD